MKILLVAMLLILGRADSKPHHRVGVLESGIRDDGRHFARTALSDWDTSNGNGALIFADANASKDTGVSASVGFLKLEKAGPKGFQVSHNVLTAGLEAQYGGIGRLSVFDGTLHAGPVDINAGVGFETGLIFNNGFEAKIGGLGGKITKEEIQICYIVCFGFRWG
ncbi:unnamed protein product [Allacma fusca]|uniref:Uncharacterized protein n=1 Tax=Allacma fusca TaxID=39272 RepID=A0A8J2L1R4_9HEXA|nr:unnamed protein product [Allacma fusca]